MHTFIMLPVSLNSAARLNIYLNDSLRNTESCWQQIFIFYFVPILKHLTLPGMTRMSKPGTLQYANITFVHQHLHEMLLAALAPKLSKSPKRSRNPVLSDIKPFCRRSLSGTWHNEMIMNSHIQSAQVFPVSSVITRVLANRLSADGSPLYFYYRLKLKSLRLNWRICEVPT